MAPHIPESIDGKLLGIYLSDHLAGSTAGLGRIERMAKDYSDTPVSSELDHLCGAIRRERELLKKLMDDLGVPQRPHRQAAAWLVERAGRLKLNGRIVRRSPMTMVLEAELMRSAVMGKLGLWQVLEELAPDLGLDPVPLAALARDGHAQVETFSRVHEHARRNAFRKNRDIAA
ncbi:MAG: hypothetical protein JWO49_1309 [Arthrobacter sp.]|nr:hypothetical protein [Arthrobacter sp.]MCU1547505.1 hypothetical protein [Arthrobacter sp.]